MIIEKIHTINLPLERVDDKHSAIIIENGLSKLADIKSHTLELNNNRLVIDTDDASAVLPQIVKTIRELGYDVSTVKKIFPVLNMSCAACSASAESVLKK